MCSTPRLLRTLGHGFPETGEPVSLAEWWVGEADLCGGARARACDRRAHQGRRRYGGTSSETARQPLVLMLVRAGGGQYEYNFARGINEAHLLRKLDNMRWWTRLKPYCIIRGL